MVSCLGKTSMQGTKRKNMRKYSRKSWPLQSRTYAEVYLSNWWQFWDTLGKYILMKNQITNSSGSSWSQFCLRTDKSTIRCFAGIPFERFVPFLPLSIYLFFSRIQILFSLHIFRIKFVSRNQLSDRMMSKMISYENYGLWKKDIFDLSEIESFD